MFPQGAPSGTGNHSTRGCLSLFQTRSTITPDACKMLRKCPGGHVALPAALAQRPTVGCGTERQDTLELLRADAPGPKDAAWGDLSRP
jgi:hypothetical protein